MLLYTEDIETSHGRMSKTNKWSVLQPHKRGRDVEPEIGANRASVARENAGEPAPQERQDVEMPVDAPAESASVKRRSDAVADNEERAR